MSDEPRLNIGNRGWVLYEDKNLEGVYLRFEDAVGRLEITELYLSPLQSIDSDLLRALPLGQIVAWCNDPNVASDIRRRIAVPGPDLAQLASYYATTFRDDVDHWVAESMRAQIGDESPKKRRGKRREQARRPLKLSIPSGNRHPDSFYKRVAELYGEAAGHSPRPAVDLAEANGVALSTVHRWVKEARRRGFLPPGRKGRAI